MIKAYLDGFQIKLTAEQNDLAAIKRLRGAYRTSKMPPLTWAMPLTLDSVEELRREKTPCNAELAKRAQAMLDAHRFVDAQKAADKVEPIRPIPIKELQMVRIAGDIDIAKRGAIVEQFQTDPETRVFVGQIDACAEGITLTAADTVVYYSLTFNMAKYAQSQDRIHRVGQRNACTYIHLIVPHTIDEKILAALDKKVDLAKAITDNWRWMLEE